MLIRDSFEFLRSNALIVVFFVDVCLLVVEGYLAA